MAIVYIAKPGTWFDEGTEVELIDDYGENMGLFCGLCDGKQDEEICNFSEFEQVERGENGDRI